MKIASCIQRKKIPVKCLGVVVKTREDRIFKKSALSHGRKEGPGFHMDNSTDWSNHSQHVRGLNSDELLREDAVLQVWACRACQGSLPGAGAGGGSVLTCSSKRAVCLAVKTAHITLDCTNSKISRLREGNRDSSLVRLHLYYCIWVGNLCH